MHYIMSMEPVTVSKGTMKTAHIVWAILLAGAGVYGLVHVSGISGLGFGDRSPAAADAEHGTGTVVVEHLDIPWEIVFLPNGDMLVTERPGTLLRINREEGETETVTVTGVAHRGEGGLLGAALHPNFTENSFLYLYMTTDTEDGLRNRVVRYRLHGATLTHPETIIDDLPGAVYHDGGRIAFGPDNKLYITAGDATREQWAQNVSVYAGKILRVNPDGSIPVDNPFGNAVYSYGHRNPQGLTWIHDTLWATEHGDRQHDELNRIVNGGNYGWPVIEAGETRNGMRPPAIYADDVTWAPAGAATVNNTIFFAGLRGSGLYAAMIRNGSVQRLETYLDGMYGRLRAVTRGPDGFLYVSTSNTDGRFTAGPGDDKIIRVDPAALQQ